MSFHAPLDNVQHIGNSTIITANDNTSRIYEAQSFYAHALVFIGKIEGAIGMAMCCCCAPYVRVQQGFTGVVTRFGRFDRIVDPGLVYILPQVEEAQVVDMRIRSLSMDKQSLLSKDNISVTVDVIVVYKVVDIRLACFGIQDMTALLQQKAFSTIRSIVGTYHLQELLEKRI
jgi:erythrocyte band 7 integral membrane protein